MDEQKNRRTKVSSQYLEKKGHTPVYCDVQNEITSKMQKPHCGNID